MPKRLSLLLVVAAALALPSGASALDATPIPGQYIVVLHGGANGRDVAAEHSRSAHAQVLQTYDAALHGYAAKLTAAGLAKVKSDPRVATVEQDVSGHPFDAQTLPTGIDRIDAEQDSQFAQSSDPSIQTAGSQTNIAVYDTGIDTRHPDLNVVGGVDCVDPGNPYNDGTYSDSFGHGTHVAGIIAAKNDGNGVVGVVPGARLWSVRTGDAYGGGSKSAQLCGINWITQNGPSLGIKVVNSSQALFGTADDGNCGYTKGDVLHQAICASTAAGINWVFAASNGPAADFINVAGASYPEVLTVTGMADSNGQPNVGSRGTVNCTQLLQANGKKPPAETDDTYYTSSKYAVSAAEQAHTIAAPGVCIYSTWKGQTYGYLSGTSMATPHVTGVEALCVISGKCSGTPAQNIQQVRSDAAAFNVGNKAFGFKGDPWRPVSGRYYGYLVRAAGY